MPNPGRLCTRILLVALPVAVPALADVVSYQIGILDQGSGVNSTVEVPTFDPTFGNLQSVEMDASFTGMLLYQGTGESPLSYSVTADPSLTLTAPSLEVIHFGDQITVSGTTQLRGGSALIPFESALRGQIFGPMLTGPTPVNLQDLFSTSGGPSNPSKGWSLYYDSATVDIRYNYTADLAVVPEPMMAVPIAMGLAALIFARLRRRITTQP